ncbi:AAA family ATPase [Agrococcus versicolor]|uniref:AAA family ATPase n=1 Tax=Agrococcus versicolor TaxID=501482 RepID=A0ABP5MID2_9MICO
MIRRLAIDGYRSIRSLVVDLGALTVVTGANGSGKSNLYRSLRLLADCGAGRVVPSLASSGGLAGVLWAGQESIDPAVRAGGEAQGTRRKGPIALRLGFGGDDLGYAVDLGITASRSESLFVRDPSIKQEHVFAGVEPRPAATLAERVGPLARSRGDDGWHELSRTMAEWDSLLDELAGADAAPEIAGVRRTLRSWRFHDALRTDALAPARQPQIATRAVRLDDDGANLAAVLQTTIETRADGTVERAVRAAFPGSRLEMVDEGGGLGLALRQHGMLRALTAPELSDGTMQYLLLTAALTSVERPGLLVLNEPERSLHDDLLPALADRIREAADETQVVVVTHSRSLADALAGTRIELERSAGETVVAGREGPLDVPAWRWPSR